jgi:histidine ammonia-lyase
MGAVAARKAAQVVANTARILAVEALASAQALEFRKPLKTSEPLDAAFRRLREKVPAYDRDRFLAPDLEAAEELVRTGSLADAAAAVCGRLE